VTVHTEATGSVVLETPTSMSAWSLQQRRAGRRIGFVPTMGALHEGHFALVHEARRRCDLVVVSVFVNPLQFDRRDDFDRYPRPIDDDLTACRSHGVDAVYAPTAAAMYPEGFDTHVTPGAIADLLEGAARPGHFRGVTTVVAKLFGAVQPDVAVFGEKDFQQLAVIRRLTTDLDMPIEVVGHPTVRHPDGLAMSSRNRRLTAEQREAAVVVPRMLEHVRSMFHSGERSTSVLSSAAAEFVAAEPLARFEHLHIVDSGTLQPQVVATDKSRLLAAVWFDDIRLIDNMSISEAASD
jgi:pantoate--beta-alanine ligase